MAAARSLLLSVVNPTHVQKSAAIIFLHGSCDTGDGLRIWVQDLLKEELTFPHIQIIYPTAPERPYMPHLGEIKTVWFDRKRISPDVPEHLESIDSMCTELSKLIDQQVKEGVSKERIILSGFTMDGAMSMHLAYKFHPTVAGVFGLSSFLNADSIVYKVLKNYAGSLPEFFMGQGLRDDLVLPELTENTYKKLKSFNMKSHYYTFPGIMHQMNKIELKLLKQWFEEKLPNV